MATVNLPQIIGLTGRRRRGKDTTAEYLCKQYGYIQLSFAQPLKDACKRIFHFTDDQLYGPAKEVVDNRWKVTPRKVFQFVGTDLLRKQMSQIIPDIGEDIWILSLMAHVSDILKNNPNARIVVSDCRFPNETKIIKTSGLYNEIWRLSRPSLNKSTADDHESETLIDTLDVDRDIVNDGDREELYSKIDKELQEYSSKYNLNISSKDSYDVLI